MKVRYLFVGVLLLALGLTVDYVAHADHTADPVPATLPADGGDSNCVAVWLSAADASTGHSANFSWFAGTTKWLRFECYYDVGTVGPGTGGSAGASDDWVDSTFTPTTESVQINRGSGVAFTAVSSGTSGMVWSNYTVLAADDAKGYIEGQVQFTYHSGSSLAFTIPQAAFTMCWATCYSAGGRVLGTGFSTGNTWVLGHAGWVAGTGIHSPSYYWGSGPYTDAPPFCAATVTVLDVLDRQTGASLGSDPDIVLEAGDRVEFSTDYTVGITRDVYVRFWGGFDPVDPTGFQQIYSSLTGVFADPAVVTVTVPPSYGVSNAVRLGDASLRCFDIGLNNYLYASVDSAELTDNQDRISPCMVARWYWPQQRLVGVGDVLTFGLQYSGIFPASVTDTTIHSIEWAATDENADPPVQVPFASMTWTEFSGAADLPLGTFASYNVSAVYAGSVRQFVTRCTDFAGTHYSMQWAQGVRVNPSDDPFDLDAVENRDRACVETAGLSLHPSTWLPAGGRMVSCIAKALFVPRDSSVSALLDSADAATEKAPISFIAESGALVYSSVDGADAAVVGNRDGCFVVLPAMTDIELAAQSVCPADLASGPLSTARTILSALFWVGFAWSLWTMTRKLIAQ